MNINSLAKFFLRAGLAFVLVYASVEIYYRPDNFLKYVPPFVLQMISMDLFLPIFGVVEIILALWLLSGWKGQYPSMLAVMMMVGIVVFNMDYFQILFRNVAIGFGALALFVLELTQENKSKEPRKMMQSFRA